MNEQEQMFLSLIEQHKQIIYKVCFMYASDGETIDDLLADEQERENLRELYALINRLGKLERALILLWLEEASANYAGD